MVIQGLVILSILSVLQLRFGANSKLARACVTATRRLSKGRKYIWAGWQTAADTQERAVYWFIIRLT